MPSRLSALRAPSRLGSAPLLTLGLALARALTACSADADADGIAGTNGADAGSFGVSAPTYGDAESDADLPDNDAAPSVGTAVRMRIVHAMPNVGPVVLCRFEELELDDPATPADELARTHPPGELVFAGDDPALGVAYGAMSGWFNLQIEGTHVLALHRLAVPPDAGVPEDAAVDAGLDADTEDAALPADPCDPNSLEVALQLPMADNWLPPPPLPPLLALDAGVADASAEPSDASAPERDAYAGDADGGPPAPTVSQLRLGRGISSELRGGADITLYASGLVLSPSALAARAADVGAEAAYAIDRAAGPRILLSEVPAAPSADFSLSLTHLVPDLPLASSPGAVGDVRACITIDGVESSALPTRAAPPVGFREQILLASGLPPSARFRIRVFAAEDLSTIGQDCANTTRAPLAQLEAEAGRFRARRSYTLVLSGLTSPENLCPLSPNYIGLARPGCFGKGDYTVALALDPD